MVEVKELKKFESSIILMRMALSKKKDIRETAEVRCARRTLNGYVVEKMIKIELLGGWRKKNKKGRLHMQ